MKRFSIGGWLGILFVAGALFAACNALGSHKIGGIEIRPVSILFEKPGDKVQLTVAYFNENITKEVDPAKFNREFAKNAVVWSTSDEKIATVDNGLVTGVSVGTAVIAAQVAQLTAHTKVDFRRPPTAEELQAAAAKRRQEQEDAEAAEQAKLKVKQRAEEREREWNASDAKKICDRHPGWPVETCERLAQGKIWIGMSYDQLVESYGRKPTSAIPSDYGKGVQWQWCWEGFQPSCFYGKADKIITSYN